MKKHCALPFEDGRHIESVFKLYSSAFRAVGQTVGEKARARCVLTPSYNGLGFMSWDFIQKRKKELHIDISNKSRITWFVLQLQN